MRIARILVKIIYHVMQISTEMTEVLRQTRKDIVAFDKYILEDEDPEPWQRLLRMFFGQNARELIMIIGRKGGKSVRAAKIALFYVYKLIADPEYRKQFWLIPGQPIYILIVSTTRDQAENIILDYAKTFAKKSWYLRNFIMRKREKRDELVFEGNIIVRAQGSSSSATRGYPCIVVIFDELAHFVDTQGKRSGKQVYEALKPNIALFGNEGRVIILTTPGPKSGIVYELVTLAEKGELKNVYIKVAPTWEMRPDIPAEFFEEERLRDPDTFKCEYGAEFYETIDAFLDPKKIDACFTEPPMRLGSPGPWSYYMTMDPGVKKDSYSIMLMHMDGDRAKLDFGKTFTGSKKEPVQISEVEAFAEDICANYPVVKIGIDQAQSASTVQNFKKKGLPIKETFFTADYNMKIYERLRRFVNSGHLDLPPWSELMQELKMLQIKVGSNKFSVSAPRGFTDDKADALANCVYMMTEKSSTGTVIVSSK